MFGLFKKKLPHCDDLFVKYLAPWYPEDERPEMTRPDMYVISAYEGMPLDLATLQYLPEELLTKVRQQTQSITEAALADYQKIIESDTLDLNVLDAVDKFYNRSVIAGLIKTSDPTDFANDYLIAVCEFGATIGHLFRESEDFDWLYSYPYFHSIIVHKETGFGITVFDWAIKKHSEYGVDDGFVAKFHAAIKAIKKYQDENESNL